MCKTPKKIFFFPGGTTAVCDEENQIPELQKSWFLLFVEFLQSKGVKVEDVEEIWLPDRTKAEYLREEHTWLIKAANEHSIMNRKVSDIITDMIQNRVEGREVYNIEWRRNLNKVENSQREKLNSEFDELKQEMEDSLETLVSDYIIGMQERGEIR